MVNSSEFQLVKVIQKLEIFSNLEIGRAHV